MEIVVEELKEYMEIVSEAVQKGLTFEGYKTSSDKWVIKFTGGF
jgi:hypothetical protein